MNSNDYGYGGQKRPLEDGGMHSLLLHLLLFSIATMPGKLQVALFFFFFSCNRVKKHFVPFIDHDMLFHFLFNGETSLKPLCSNLK